MAAGDFATITLVWHTAGFAHGSYSISAYGSPVENETSIADNTLVGSYVIVTVPGDVNGDYEVDLYDIVAICAAYGSKQGEPGYVSNCDTNGDGITNLYDAVIACSHYGQRIPESSSFPIKPSES